MKSRMSLAGIAVLAAMLALPAGAEAGFCKPGMMMKRDFLFGWLRRDEGKKVAVKKAKKKVARKAKKKAKKG